MSKQLHGFEDIIVHIVHHVSQCPKRWHLGGIWILLFIKYSIFVNVIIIWSSYKLNETFCCPGWNLWKSGNFAVTCRSHYLALHPLLVLQVFSVFCVSVSVSVLHSLCLPLSVVPVRGSLFWLHHWHLAGVPAPLSHIFGRSLKQPQEMFVFLILFWDVWRCWQRIKQQETTGSHNPPVLLDDEMISPRKHGRSCCCLHSFKVFDWLDISACTDVSI